MTLAVFVNVRDLVIAPQAMNLGEKCTYFMNDFGEIWNIRYPHSVIQ